MKLNWRTELPQWALIAGMFLLAAVTWPWAPDRLPAHWNAAGQIDRYGGKVEGLLALPLTALGIYLLLLLVPRVDPGRANYERFAGAYATIRLAVVILLALVYGAIHLWLRGHALDMSTAIPLLVGGLFLIIGNVMGKIRPNWFVGIRTPWTLSSKVAWVKTHRLGGWLFVALGLALVAAGVLRTAWFIYVLLAGAVLSVLWMYVYSYRVWRQDPDKVPPAGTLPGE